MQSLSEKANKFLVCGVLSAAVLFGCGANAHAVVVPTPNQPVAGQSQLALAQQWTQWALGIPAATNPITDPNGDFAQINNAGAVFFLAGNTGGASTRTIDVPLGRPLFFPVLNGFDVEWPSGTHTAATVGTCFDPAGTTESQALACAQSGLAGYQISSATGLFATLDGVSLVPDVSLFRQTSSAFFNLTLPEDNLFTAFYALDGGNDFKSIQDGYWLALEDLAPGSHTLAFGGTFNYADGSTNVVSVVDVLKVPEPPTALLLAAALFALTSLKRRKSDSAPRRH